MISNGLEVRVSVVADIEQRLSPLELAVRLAILATHATGVHFAGDGGDDGGGHAAVQRRYTVSRHAT
jgi:hypothetical protein